ncbi:hypothetical protein Clacol_007944 [Clathrus columnatus]|uniref:Uncharacterized protein n=1 Tax=Clathrus columnatus TaxID=1419009 RepID=A0AAV5AKS4_9AGAM|nr:hypothetical protein Clacol_007944 [Clathrus columnatus]
MSHTPSQASGSLLRCNASSAALAGIRSSLKQCSRFLRSQNDNLRSTTWETVDSPISPKDLNCADLDSKSSSISSGKRRPRHDAIPSAPPVGTRRSTKSLSHLPERNRVISIPKLSCSSPLKRRIDSNDDKDLEDHPSDVGGSERPLKKMRIESCLRLDDQMPSCSKSVVESNLTATAPLPKWQPPRSSPLGPRTSKYRRRSKQSYYPSRGPTKSTPNLFIRCVSHAFQLDNKNRNPSLQTPQWCEDLLVSGLKDYLHPNYQCRHIFHPSDPEFDEEWSDETWSDEEWSDSEDEEFEDCPPSPPDSGDVSDVDMDVTILAPEEHTPEANQDLELHIKSHWKWHTPSKCSSSLSLPWRPESDVRSEKALSMAIST